MTEVKSITMEDVLHQINKLTQFYKRQNIGLVIGISRGGIIPGYLMSEWLNCDYLTIRANVSLSDDILQRKCRILIMDDIIDTEATKKIVMRQFNGRKDVFFETIVKAKKGTWILFPWECGQDQLNSRQTEI